jgi:hypothetical protein
MNTVLPDALAYAELGWPVFPCAPKAKRPLTARGFKDATRAAETIHEMWARWPDANLGVVTGEPSGFWVLDVDGDKGSRSLDELQSTHGELPKTAEARTGRGGRHLLFRHVGERVRNRTRFRPGLDIRGEGGYIVAPSSETVAPYEWARDPRQLPIAAAPDWVLALVQQRCSANPLRAEPNAHTKTAIVADAESYAKAAFAQEMVNVANAHIGERNDTLNRASFALGGYIRDSLLDGDLVTRCLREMAIARGLFASETERTIASGLTAGAAKRPSVYQRERLIFSLPIRAPSKLLLSVLAHYSDANGFCWPSQRTLIRDCSFGGFRALIRAFQDAVPFFEVLPGRGGRAGRSNRYLLKWETIERAALDSASPHFPRSLQPKKRTPPRVEGCSALTVSATCF